MADKEVSYACWDEATQSEADAAEYTATTPAFAACTYASVRTLAHAEVVDRRYVSVRTPEGIERFQVDMMFRAKKLPSQTHSN